MPRQVYPGQFKFHINEEAKQANRKVATRLRMVKLRQNRSKEQINNQNLLQIQWRKKQRQQQDKINEVNQQFMAQRANERYDIFFHILNLYL